MNTIDGKATVDVNFNAHERFAAANDPCVVSNSVIDIQRGANFSLIVDDTKIVVVNEATGSNQLNLNSIKGLEESYF